MGNWVSRLSTDKNNERTDRFTDTEPESPRIPLLEEPWRYFEKGGDFKTEYANNLLTETKENDFELSGEIDSINIFLGGPIKAGKTSFVNTLASIDKGRISQVAVAGGAGISQTTQMRPFTPRRKLNTFNFKIFDTMGVEEGDFNGLNIQDVMSVVKGNVPPFYKFNQTSPIDAKTEGYNTNPTTKDRMHCVVFVLDANIIGNENIPRATRKKIESIQKALHDAHIPRIVLLTKIDELCEKVEKDVTKTYLSAKVKTAVDNAIGLFSVPEQNVFPVKCYSSEQDTDYKKEILALLALRQMIRFAKDFLEEQC